ncbi:hypothetical protein Taro_030130 [Colocasia esculenta]|uniref:Uncharacterized protein n=1 Tax=Colocasia esculenta TaxID=4460 RepID=A0A843W2E3_COLES|nr:hypothetical protein [Colocasia esculenta]
MPSSTRCRAAGSTTEQQVWLTEQATCSVPSSQENPSGPSSPCGSYNGYTMRAPRSSVALTAEYLNAAPQRVTPPLRTPTGAPFTAQIRDVPSLSLSTSAYKRHWHPSTTGVLLPSFQV